MLVPRWVSRSPHCHGLTRAAAEAWPQRWGDRMKQELDSLGGNPVVCRNKPNHDDQARSTHHRFKPAGMGSTTRGWSQVEGQRDVNKS